MSDSHSKTLTPGSSLRSSVALVAALASLWGCSSESAKEFSASDSGSSGVAGSAGWSGVAGSAGWSGVAGSGGSSGATGSGGSSGATGSGGTPSDAGPDSGSCPTGRLGSTWGCDVNWLSPPSDLKTSGPIVFDGDQGKVIQDLRIVNAPGNAITLKNCNDIVIQNVEISGAGDNGIRVENCDKVTIRNSYIHNTNTKQQLHSGYAVYLYNAGDGNRIAGNWFEDCAGGLRVESSSDATGLTLRNNFHRNPHRAKGGSQGQLAIFATTERLVSALVTENVSLSAVGKAYNEDHINFYRSGGTAASPVKVTQNRIRGNGGSRTSCGIILGDTGKSPAAAGSAYVTADSNVLVDPAAAGLCISGGHHHVFTNNRVFGSRNAADLKNSNVGVVVWRQKGQPGSLHTNTVGGAGQENQVLWWSDFNANGAFKNAKWWTDKGDDGQTPNHGTLAQGNSYPTGWANNDFDHTAWDQAGGNAGYAALWKPTWDQWSHFPGP